VAGVILVHDDRRFAAEASRRIRELGHEVFVYSDPMTALSAFGVDEPAPALLLTRTQFPAGQPHGLALALMARVKLPGLPVVMVGRRHLAEFADGVAEFLPHPVDFDGLVLVVQRLLSGGAGGGAEDPPATQNTLS
jgi:DNA-binding NtrC family response regulator